MEQAVSNAVGYKLAIQYLVGEDIVTDYTNVIKAITFDLSDKQVAGGVVTKITISAIGDGKINIDSIYYDIENPLDFTKLSISIAQQQAPCAKTAIPPESCIASIIFLGPL